MAGKRKPPAVVAELGRPETPAETAARKAENSRLYRERKTVNNLVLSLIVCLGLVFVIVLIVPQDSGGYADRSVDAQQLAAEAAPSAGRDLAAPDVDASWKAKQAALTGDSSVTRWQINYTTADEAYAAVVQAFTGDGSPVAETWIAEQLEGKAATGTEELGGLTWTVYDHTGDDPDASNVLFGMQTEWQGDTILVYGTDTPGTIRVLATQVAQSLEGSAAANSEESE